MVAGWKRGMHNDFFHPKIAGEFRHPAQPGAVPGCDLTYESQFRLPDGKLTLDTTKGIQPEPQVIKPVADWNCYAQRIQATRYQISDPMKGKRIHGAEQLDDTAEIPGSADEAG